MSKLPVDVIRPHRSLHILLSILSPHSNLISSGLFFWDLGLSDFWGFLGLFGSFVVPHCTLSLKIVIEEHHAHGSVTS
jgi:hypothetical protein